MRIEGRIIHLDQGETIQQALRIIINENIFPKGANVPIRKISKDFLRQMRFKVRWHFNDFNKEYIKENFGMKFYKEMIGNE